MYGCSTSRWLAAIVFQVAGNRLLDFERTRKGPIVENSGEMSLHRHHMMSR